MPDTKRYVRLRNLLQEKIVSGAYEPGDRFFSQTELMRKYSLSFSTVIRALDELVAEGYLVRQQGKGTFVANTSPRPQQTGIEQKYLSIFAAWDMGSNHAVDQFNTAVFYKHLNDLKPSWLHLRLIPTTADAESLEPWLFSREPTDAALCIYPTANQLPILAQIAEQYPVVALSLDPSSDSKITTIQTDYETAGLLATRHLIDAGHTSIACLTSTNPTRATSHFMAGYRRALREASYPYSESIVASSGPADPTGYHATLRLFDNNSSTHITAIIAADSALFPGVIYAAESMHLDIPQQLAVVCMDEPQQATNLASHISFTRFPYRELAEVAISRVCDAIAGKETASLSIMPELRSPASPPG